MTKCVDYTDLTTLNRLAVASAPTINSDGTFNTNHLDVFAQEMANNILIEADNNPISIAVNTYGDSFYRASNYINTTFKGRAQNFLVDYPDLNRRWERGLITNLEVADFIRAFNYTPTDLIDQSNYLKLTRELDSYYKDSFATSIMGGFCATMQNIFNQIDAFYDLIGVVDGIVTDALAIVDKIRSFDGFKDLTEEKIKEELIKLIKKQLNEVIDKIFQEIQDAINNFNIESIVGDLTGSTIAGIKAILTIKEQMCAFFTEENKKGLKAKMEALIDYALSLFESPTLEQIQFMVYRFCAFATNIEALLKDIKKPLDDYAQRYRRIVNRLTAISNVNTATALRYGALRYSEEARTDGINRLTDLWEGRAGRRITPTGEEPTTVKSITVAEYNALPKCGKVWKGQVPWIKVEGDWTDEKDGIGIYGYTRIDLDVKVYLKRIYDDIGGQYTITEGWFSKDWNEKKEYDPSNSHLSGLVIDIKKDMPDVDAFTDAALKHGFRGVVVYDDSIHLDVREIPR